MTLGSLFDGAGTCCLAAELCGITPVWSSEIERFPLEVTKRRFPTVKQLGDVTKIKGSKIEPVDIISFGSPCQDLSVAGKRAGLKGERSGLFMEAIRIIKEMRDATANEFPRFAIWENVLGAFSSNKGEDFRAVLEEFCKVKDGDASIPRPAGGGDAIRWRNAGLILADGYSVAWRVLDAQFWGIPQRRRRIFALADFGGRSAGEILFERDGLQRSFASRHQSWAHRENASRDEARAHIARECYDARGNGDGNICGTITGDHERRVTDFSTLICEAHVFPPVAKTLTAEGADGSPCFDNRGAQIVITAVGLDAFNQTATGDKARTVIAGHQDAMGLPCVLAVRERCGCEGGGKGCLVQEDISGSIRTMNDQFIVVSAEELFGDAPCYCLQGNGIDRSDENGYNGKGYAEEVSYTLTAIDRHAVLVCRKGERPRCYVIHVRRLTPTECARLQGMPDWWCVGVPHADAPEYKMWGNGMALPCVLYVFEGLKKYDQERRITS